MKRFTTAFATAAALTVAAPAAFATSTFSFDDVTTMEAANGSQVFTNDGVLFGTLTDVDIDGGKAEMIVEVANSSNIPANEVFVTADEGQVLFADDRLVLQISETELNVGINGDNETDETARIFLVD